MSTVSPPSVASASGASSVLEQLGDHALVFSRPDVQTVRLSGRDARGFVHRMSSNGFADAGAGDACLTVFPDKRGRMVALVHALALGEEDVVLIGSTRPEQRLAAWLDGFHFAEKMEIAGADDAVVIVGGAGAAAAVDAVVSGAADAPRWGFAGDDARFAVRTFDLVDGAGDPQPAWLLRGDVGALGVPADDAAWELARVAAGIPSAPGEVCERFNPLELGLHDAIHWAKGCYIGQEVISRIDNYDKQSRHMVALSARSGAAVCGERLLRDGNDLGDITSAAGGGSRALAVVKHPPDVGLVLTSSSGAELVVVERRAAQAPHD